MAGTIDYFHTCISPFTWLGHQTLVEIARRHRAPLRYRPFNIAKVWQASGSVPLDQRSPTRQRYRLIELQRVAEMRGLQIRTQPTNFPTNPTLADHCVIAIQEMGADPGPFLFSVGEALWVHDRQIADEGIVEALLAAGELDAPAILARAKSEDTAKLRAENTEAAIKADVIGAPAYVYSGEVFWGQDRLSFLDAMIASGRVAFKPE